ncbi:hypothetical protein J1N35_001321 [Gossypium stocksii]|uniref:Membrane-bound transcription factor PTM chromo domain-containing protein n=1 Tax=Gossypium stocksii TaxID=47602 RepID=A0A9D3WK75_9ROSI|nr:hypothetical protein J1N35_001321 [Gossypium stocksii]
MKNVVDIEKIDDQKEKYWFHVTYIPLYLIKEYEERMSVSASPPVKKPLSELSELQSRQLKASRRNIFSYLISKRDKSEKCSCASCQMDVLLRNAVKCGTCQAMGKAKKAPKFAGMKKIVTQKAIKHHKDQVLNPNKKDLSKEKLPRNVPNFSSALFFTHNTSLGPPYRVLVDTNFINFSIQNKVFCGLFLH